MAFIDFKEVKSKTTMAQTVERLGLQMQAHGPQLRSACPACKHGGDRALTVNLDKGLFFCFSKKEGGDQIALVAHIQGSTVNEAANWLAGTVPLARNNSSQNKGSSTVPTAPQQGRKPGFDVDAYALKLDPGAPALQPLGISPETLKEWKAGYANTGTNRGRLAIALHDRDGNTIGFAGRALGNEQPSITIPNGINPQEIIFGSERVTAGTIYLVRDVLDVIKASEAGVGNVICFLTDISALQVEMLAALMSTKSCDMLELF